MPPTSEVPIPESKHRKFVQVNDKRPAHDQRALIDIKHPAQLNLFKGLAKELVRNDWKVTICYLNRGKLPGIVERELRGFDLVPVGSSKGTRWSILWNGNIKRTFQFMKLLLQNQYNICVAASSIPLALACRITGIPIIQFYDDPERKLVNRVNATLSTHLFFPPVVNSTAKVSVFNCLKEWSYLSPSRFKPDLRVLEQYGLVPHEYVFIREVSNKSFNYYGQTNGMIQAFSQAIRPDMPVVLSLEDKSLASGYPPHWKILQEPVTDIHSLIYYSKAVLSSGDSMAREGAMLGIPSIYCGIREMRANQLLIQEGMLEHHPGGTSIAALHAILEKPFNLGLQHSFRNGLKESWVDMIDFMMHCIEQYKLTFKN